MTPNRIENGNRPLGGTRFSKETRISAAVSWGRCRLFADDSSDVVALLDWELATFGHPLSDVAYLAMPPVSRALWV